MLLQFTVENFKSFKDAAVLSLEASVDKDLPNNVTTLGKDRILNTVALYGANASGKSNIFRALTAAILSVRLSNNRQVNEPISGIVPYVFTQDPYNKPTFFEFVFIMNGKKYVYGFATTKMAVQKEYLHVFNSAKATTVFERNGDNYKFTSAALKKDLLPLTKRNTPNKLFLATATAWNASSTRDAYLWFESKINTYSTDINELFPNTAALFADDTGNSLHRFTNNILREADINIHDYEFEMKDVSFEQFKEQFPPQLRDLFNKNPLENNKSIRIEAVHNILTDKGLMSYKLPLQEESQGTQALFLFAPVLKKAFEGGETICVDEFDSSLHPLLLKYLVGLFNNPSINKAHAQLIISTHSMALLSLENLRRDEIYFVDKDRHTGVSELYSLDEFSPRKAENIRKAYLLGRYGSVPDIFTEADLWH